MKCPECGNAEQGQFMGYEDPMLYDGVLVWRCLKCGHAWGREFGISYRDHVAREWAAKMNAES